MRSGLTVLSRGLLGGRLLQQGYVGLEAHQSALEAL